MTLPRDTDTPRTYIPPLKVLEPYDLWRTKRGRETKPANRWRGGYQDGTRKSPHTKEFGKKTDARDWAVRQVAAIEAGEHVSATDAKVTLGRWADEWLDLQTCGANSKTTYGWALRVILAYFGAGTPVSEIRERHLKAFLISLEGRYSFRARVYMNKILGQLLGEAHRNGLTPKCAWVALRVTPDADFDQAAEEHADEGDARVYPTTEEVWQLYDQIAPEYRAAVLLGAFAGLRVSEAAGARIEDLVDEDRDGEIVTMFRPKRQWLRPHARTAGTWGPLKTKASRKPVPVPAPIAAELRQLMDGRTTGHMVLRADGSPTDPRRINAALADAVTVIGADAGIRFHALRHYLASTAIASGEDIMTVCDRMRHKNPNITLNTYTHLVKAAERRATDAIGAEAMRGRRAATAARWAERGAEIS